jgi:protein-S-isoprenylcysteine O-methyltransferase Ste14
VALFLAFDAATALVVIPRYPDLLIERSRANSDAKPWDKVIMPLASGFLPLISYIMAGFTERWDWGPPMSQEAQIAGLVLTIAGYGVVVWAMGANAYFSPLVRIQQERGHQVADGGPYRIVRHPGYLGAIVFTLAVPILLGSWWALIPGVLAAIIYVLRTFLEDRTLAEELPGYSEYQQRTQYRLFPGVW